VPSLGVRQTDAMSHGEVGRPAAGTSSGRWQSALLIPVPEAEAAVQRHRIEHDPVAAAGVPPHITLIVPWLPPREIGPGDLRELAAIASATEPFAYSLVRTCWFGRTVLWLAPDPAAPFIALTGALAEVFGTPPYDDEFDEVVPHLTVGHASDGVELAGVAREVDADLPIACRAAEIWVMVGDGTAWSVHAQVPLGRTTGC